ncbi:MAG TPA: N4-gp56 family major capsid protein [Phenylobacterium sp.]
MADTRAATGLTVEQWDDKFFVEDIQENVFSILYEQGENAAIQVKEDLSKKKGDNINFALLNRLTGDATEGSDTLEGQEEDLTSRSHNVSVNKRRHGVLVPEMEEQKSAIGLREAAKPALKTWAQENTRDRIIRALGSVNGVAYASASEAAKDAWLADNADRVLFGAARANNASNDHSAALANIDSTNDVLKKGTLSLMKRLARTASPKIRPIQDKGNGKKVYIAYAHPFAMRDLRADMEAVLDDTTAAGQAMRLFEGGDLLWDNIIIKELEDMPVYSGVGGSGIDVAPVYLIGAQCIGFATAKRWKTIEKRFDYDDKAGVAIEAIDGFDKLTFGTGAGDTDDQKDYGLVTGYMACVADA